MDLCQTQFPWESHSLTIFSICRRARYSAVLVVLVGMKQADLVNLSTITQIESCFFYVLRSFVTKSHVILSHFNAGISKAFRDLLVVGVETLPIDKFDMWK